jgi:hypothetical protein
MTNLDYKDFEDQVYKAIIKDYGRIILKQIQQTRNQRLVKEILQSCLTSKEPVDYTAKKLIRAVTQNFV